MHLAHQRKRRAAVVPSQHGAWGFLLLPVALGIAAGGFSWNSAPVLLAWVALYPFSWALTQRLAAPRPARFNRALQVWSVVAVPLLFASVAEYLWLLWVGSLYAVGFAANVAFAAARRERSLGNDVVLILECALAVPVIAGLATEEGSWIPPTDALTPEVVVATMVCFLVLAGSTLHVRSLIRERNNPAFTQGSRAFAIACVPVIAVVSIQAGVSLVMVVPFVALAARALWLHDATWRPGRIGLVELGGLILVAAFAALVLS